MWDVTTRARQQAHSQNQAPSIHTISGQVADEILHASAKNRSLDNLSIVFVAFQRFKDYIEMFKQEIVQHNPLNNLHPPVENSSNIAPLSSLNKTP